MAQPMAGLGWEWAFSGQRLMSLYDLSLTFLLAQRMAAESLNSSSLNFYDRVVQWRMISPVGDASMYVYAC